MTERQKVFYVFYDQMHGFVQLLNLQARSCSQYWSGHSCALHEEKKNIKLGKSNVSVSIESKILFEMCNLDYMQLAGKMAQLLGFKLLLN